MKGFNGGYPSPPEEQRQTASDKEGAYKRQREPPARFPSRRKKAALLKFRV